MGERTARNHASLFSFCRLRGVSLHPTLFLSTDIIVIRPKRGLRTSYLHSLPSLSSLWRVTRDARVSLAKGTTAVYMLRRYAVGCSPFSSNKSITELGEKVSESETATREWQHGGAGSLQRSPKDEPEDPLDYNRRRNTCKLLATLREGL